MDVEFTWLYLRLWCLLVWNLNWLLFHILGFCPHLNWRSDIFFRGLAQPPTRSNPPTAERLTAVGSSDFIGFQPKGARCFIPGIERGYLSHTGKPSIKLPISEATIHFCKSNSLEAIIQLSSENLAVFDHLKPWLANAMLRTQHGFQLCVHQKSIAHFILPTTYDNLAML